MTWPDYRGLNRGPNVCMLLLMGPWTSVQVSISVTCPDYRGLNVFTLMQMASVLIIMVFTISRCPLRVFAPKAFPDNPILVSLS